MAKRPDPFGARKSAAKSLSMVKKSIRVQNAAHKPAKGR